MEKSLKKAVPFLCVERPCGFDTPRATPSSGSYGTAGTAGTRQGVGRERVEGPSAQGFYLLRAAGTGLSPVFPQDLCPGAVSPAPGEESSLLL